MSEQRAAAVSDERARLFVALELPDEVRKALATWAGGLGLGGLRLVDAGQLHVTLCFLGWQNLTMAEPIAAACRTLAGSGQLRLSLARAIWLPPRRPRVLAVSLDDPGRVLARIQADLSDRLERGGWYSPERRPYLAHVTAARMRRGAGIWPEALPDPPELSFTASQITLFRSRLSAAGARYEALAQMSLS